MKPLTEKDRKARRDYAREYYRTHKEQFAKYAKFRYARRTEEDRIRNNEQAKRYYAKNRIEIRLIRKTRYELQTTAQRKHDNERNKNNFKKRWHANPAFRKQYRRRAALWQRKVHRHNASPLAFRPFFLKAANEVYGIDLLNMTRRLYWHNYRLAHKTNKTVIVPPSH
jgi:hypothetical protein